MNCPVSLEVPQSLETHPLSEEHREAYVRRELSNGGANSRINKTS